MSWRTCPLGGLVAVLTTAKVRRASVQVIHNFWSYLPPPSPRRTIRESAVPFTRLSRRSLCSTNTKIEVALAEMPTLRLPPVRSRNGRPCASTNSSPAPRRIERSTTPKSRSSKAVLPTAGRRVKSGSAWPNCTRFRSSPRRSPCRTEITRRAGPKPVPKVAPLGRTGGGSKQPVLDKGISPRSAGDRGTLNPPVGPTVRLLGQDEHDPRALRGLDHNARLRAAPGNRLLFPDGHLHEAARRSTLLSQLPRPPGQRAGRDPGLGGD